MERYEAYKDSGVEWIGEIPVGWDVVPLKQRYIFTTGFTPDTKRSEYYDSDGHKWATIADLNHDVVFETISRISNQYIKDYNPKPIPAGSLMYSFKLSAGKTAFAGESLYTNEAIASFSPDNPCVRYLKYSSYLIAYAANKNIYGAKILNSSLIKNALMLFPPIGEQQAIADYLDAKTAEIDELVADCEREVELLREYRKAVISEAVTKGLDPDIRMKDSASKWIDRIPEGWIVAPLKFFCNLITDGVHQTPDYQAEGVPFLSIKDMSSGKIMFDDCKYISEKEHLELHKHAPVEEGDLLFARIGTLGVTVVVRDCPTFDIFVSLGLLKLRPESINAEYLAYCMNSDYYCSYIQTVKAGGGTAAAKFNLGDVSNSPIVVPPTEDQLAIATFLDTKTAEIDSLIEAKQSMTDKLREYRKSLISEGVTGKFKVPGV